MAFPSGRGQASLRGADRRCRRYSARRRLNSPHSMTNTLSYSPRVVRSSNSAETAWSTIGVTFHTRLQVPVMVPAAVVHVTTVEPSSDDAAGQERALAQLCGRTCRATAGLRIDIECLPAAAPVPRSERCRSKRSTAGLCRARRGRAAAIERFRQTLPVLQAGDRQIRRIWMCSPENCGVGSPSVSNGCVDPDVVRSKYPGAAMLEAYGTATWPACPVCGRRAGPWAIDPTKGVLPAVSPAGPPAPRHM